MREVERSLSLPPSSRGRDAGSRELAIIQRMRVVHRVVVSCRLLRAASHRRSRPGLRAHLFSRPRIIGRVNAPIIHPSKFN